MRRAWAAGGVRRTGLRPPGGRSWPRRSCRCPPARVIEIAPVSPARGSTAPSTTTSFYIDESGRVRTRTNNSGGVQGGISNGEHVLIRIGFKPTATILQEQRTVNREHEETTYLLVAATTPAFCRGRCRWLKASDAGVGRPSAPLPGGRARLTSLPLLRLPATQPTICPQPAQ